MHHRLDVMRLTFNTFFLKTFWYRILREQQNGITPAVTIIRHQQKCTRWWNLLVFGIAQIVLIEPPIPVCHHRLVIIGPVTIRCNRVFTIASHRLDIMYAHHRG